MKGSLVVLLKGVIAVRCNKCCFGSNIRAGESGKPIDTASDALIYLFLAGKIGFGRINMRD